MGEADGVATHVHGHPLDGRHRGGGAKAAHVHPLFGRRHRGEAITTHAMQLSYTDTQLTGDAWRSRNAFTNTPIC
eukprot:6171629-Amphidinium_carterae.2